MQREEAFIPNLDDFNLYRRHIRRVAKLPLSDQADEVLELGFRRLAFQTMAQSGWADGGPRGGRAQSRCWAAQKWWPAHIKSVIRLSSDRMHLPRAVRITNRDFIPIIADTNQHRLLFCDPPYVLNNPKWPQRYHGYGFSDGDHVRLAEMLRRIPHPWILTYGNHCRVRELYQWAQIENLTDDQLLITR